MSTEDDYEDEAFIEHLRRLNASSLGGPLDAARRGRPLLADDGSVSTPQVALGYLRGMVRLHTQGLVDNDGLVDALARVDETEALRRRS
jgi:hypothetical protein